MINFTIGVKLVMADNKIATIKEAATYLGIGYQTLYKIMTKGSNPTIPQCIKLINKGGFSANWLFLDRLPIYLTDELTLNKIAKSIANIEKKL